MHPDNTLNEIIYRDLQAKGYTCRHCKNWRKVAGEEICELDRPNFPTLCRDERYFVPIEGIEPDGGRV